MPLKTTSYVVNICLRKCEQDLLGREEQRLLLEGGGVLRESWGRSDKGGLDTKKGFINQNHL